jgi:hypothetical protein
VTIHRLINIYDVQQGDTLIVSAATQPKVVVSHIREEALEQFQTVYSNHEVRLVVEDDDEALRQDLEEIANRPYGDEDSDPGPFLDSLERVAAIVYATRGIAQVASCRRRARVEAAAIADAEAAAAAARAVRDEAKAIRDHEEAEAAKARLAETSKGWD